MHIHETENNKSNKRYKPLVDRLFWIISIPTAVLMLASTALAVFAHPPMLVFMSLMTLWVFYLLVSSLFGYVELRDGTLFIKYGLILKKEIPYSKIRGVVKERRFYSESMISLKNAFEHINIKYNTFDVTTVSVVGNDELISELNARLL